MDMESGQSLKTVIEGGHTPLVFKHVLDEWPALQWSPEYLSQVLTDKILDCKISLIQHDDFQWESDCLHLKITMRQYVDWLHDKTDDENPLQLFDRTKFSCYIDYKYMKDMFEEQPHILKSVSWDVFGLEKWDGEHSTIWIGSGGTYTPCHQDTYGFNLVAQIQGRKRWYLFNPEQTDFMYPTRIPYEESSIYSEVNVRNPDLERHRLFQKTTPYIIELVPGDVLYVPSHWWHFVESLEPSISINTWVPMVEDGQSQLEESVSRLLYTCLSSNLLSETERNKYLNTGEELEDGEVNVKYIQRAVQTVLTSCLSNSSHQHDFEMAQIAADNQVEKHSEEHACNNLQKFTNKFQDNFVTVSCLCGISVNETEKNFDANVRKRKCFQDDIDESDERCVRDHPFKERKVHTDLAVNNEEEDITVTKEGSLPCVKDTSCEPKSRDGVILEHGGKTNETLVEIFAAKPFTFNEFLRFLEKAFDYEIKTEHINSNASELDGFFKTVPSSLTKDLSLAATSTSSSVGLSPYNIEKHLDKSAKLKQTENKREDLKEEKLDEKDNHSQQMEEIPDVELNKNDISTISTADIINSILHPSVIRQIGNVILNKIKK